jgi:putative PIN family toxin of toxin-antitoxin system
VIRAVIDTNVLVSGLLSPAGNEAMILLAIHHRMVRVCLSEPIMTEYRAVLARPKFRFPAEEIEDLLNMLLSNGELISAGASSIASPDPGDTKFLQCAHAGRADFIVTGNKRDFPDPAYGPAHVVSAGELLERLTLDL